jgi:hypothetical protein
MFWAFKVTFDMNILAFFAQHLFWLLFAKIGPFFNHLVTLMTAKAWVSLLSGIKNSNIFLMSQNIPTIFCDSQQKI